MNTLMPGYVRIAWPDGFDVMRASGEDLCVYCRTALAFCRDWLGRPLCRAHYDAAIHNERADDADCIDDMRGTNG